MVLESSRLVTSPAIVLLGKLVHQS